jgi:hypothetical protein
VSGPGLCTAVAGVSAGAEAAADSATNAANAMQSRVIVPERPHEKSDPVPSVDERDVEYGPAWVRPIPADEGAGELAERLSAFGHRCREVARPFEWTFTHATSSGKMRSRIVGIPLL